MQEQINSLKNRIEELERYISNRQLQQVSLPLDDISGLIISDKLNPPVFVATSTASTQNINLSGSPETIVVPAQPSGSVGLRINGTTYYFLYK